jgi:hypothetical protein
MDVVEATNREVAEQSSARAENVAIVGQRFTASSRMPNALY